MGGKGRKRLAIAASCLAVVLVACTAFDGLTAESPDAESTGPDPSIQLRDAMAEGSDMSTPVVAPPPSYLPKQEDAALLCSRLHACPLLLPSVIASLGVPLPTSNFSLCMDWANGPLPADRIGIDFQAKALACMARARSCAEAGDCLAYEGIPDDDARCPGPDAGADAATRRCLPNGDLLDCEIRQISHCDDPMFGARARCQEDQGNFECAIDRNCTTAVEGCSLTALDTCTRNQTLAAGLHVTKECPIAGYTCGNDVDSGALGCLTAPGKQKSCLTLGSGNCDGNLAQVCDGFQYSEFNCATMGGRCDINEGSPRCVHPHEECTPFSLGVNTCKDGMLQLCVGGKRVAFDCGSIGQRCAASGTQRAVCAP
jgi:hypothetical protein